MSSEELAKSFRPVNVADLIRPGSYGQVAVFCCRRCGAQFGQNSDTVRYGTDPGERGLVVPDGWSFIDGITPQSLDYYCAPCSQTLRKVAYNPADPVARPEKPR